MLSNFFTQDTIIYSWFLLPLFIFVARIMDVSLGTFRLAMISRGLKRKAALLGFFELLIWLIATSRIFHHLDNVMMYVAYAGGFATGTWMGMRIEEVISPGIVLVRVITRQEAGELIDYLRSCKMGTTTVDAIGQQGPVKIIFTIVKRQHLSNVIDTINRFNPRAFYSIEDVRFVKEGFVGKNVHPLSIAWKRWGPLFRKSK